VVNRIHGINPDYTLNIKGSKIGKVHGGKFKSTMDRLRKDTETGAEATEKSMDGKDKIIVERPGMVGKKTTENKILQDVFRNLESGHKKIDSILKLSLSGVKLSQQELLTLQMRVYRFTQEVELISKIVEKGTSGIKQVINTQI